MDKIAEILLETYPVGKCALSYKTPFELLVASRLSAQCTDIRVNLVTAVMFKSLETPEDFKNAELQDLENYIHSCGLYHTKAKDIKEMSRQICDEFGGEIPDNMSDLLKLRGIGRKIANLIMGEIYGEQGVIIADTHFIRLSNRLGYLDSKNPLIVEKTMRTKIPKDKSLLFCHALVSHGRLVCKAKNPDCDNCVVAHLCEFANVL